VTRECLRTQLARIGALWPSMQPSAIAFAEWERALYPFSDLEIERAVGVVIDSYIEASAPKPGHVIAAVKAARGPQTGAGIAQFSDEPPLTEVPDWRSQLRMAYPEHTCALPPGAEIIPGIVAPIGLRFEEERAA
jgi:hypothetical protein